MPDDITKRMRYFDRQFLRAKDFQDEQAYHLNRRRRHNRLLHTYGIAEGLEVKQSSVLGEEKMVLVTRGTAYDPQGLEIVLSADQKLDLSSVAVSPGSPVSYTSPLYLTITYTEEPSDPSTDPGINGSTTRTLEKPLLQPSPTAPTDPNQLLLAVIERDTSNGNVTTIDTNPPGRRRAGTLPPGSIGSAELRDGAVQSRHIAPADTGTDQTLTSGSGVKTGHIKDQAIAAEKLADNAVTSRAIADQAIAPEKLADNAVTSRAIAPADAGTAQTLTTGSGVKTGHIKDGAITQTKVAPGTISLREMKALVSVEGTDIVPGNGVRLIPPTVFLPQTRPAGYYIPNISITNQVTPTTNLRIAWQEEFVAFFFPVGPGFPIIGRQWRVTNLTANAATIAYKIYKIEET